MSERRIITVDSHGEAEIQSRQPKKQSTALRIGNVAIPLGEASLTPDQIGGADYFVEPGGMVIDTKTGTIVDTGDGRVRTYGLINVPREAIQSYEEKNK